MSPLQVIQLEVFYDVSIPNAILLGRRWGGGGLGIDAGMCVR